MGCEDETGTDQNQQAADANLAALVRAASGPMRVSSDAGSAEQFPLKDLIELNKYLYGIASASAGKRKRGLRFNLLTAGATVNGRAGDSCSG